MRSTLNRFEWKPEGQFATESAGFHVDRIVPLTGAAADRDFAPSYPGITDSNSLHDWDPPFPLDLSLVRPSDEGSGRNIALPPKPSYVWSVADGYGARALGACLRFASLRRRPLTARGCARRWIPPPWASRWCLCAPRPLRRPRALRTSTSTSSISASSHSSWWVLRRKRRALGWQSSRRSRRAAAMFPWRRLACGAADGHCGVARTPATWKP